MIAVYAHPNGADYVAEVGDDGWVRWPAERRGWLRRQPCGPAEAEWDELPGPLSMLALRLSGGPCEVDDDRNALEADVSLPARLSPGGHP